MLLGVGGVGTHSLLDLVSLGFTNITAIDFDKIELSNCNRQILYGESDVGRKKIDAAKDVIARYIAPERHNIIFHDLFIDGPDAIAPFVADADVVVGCVDRPTNVVAWINEACVRTGVPFTSGKAFPSHGRGPRFMLARDCSDYRVANVLIRST